MSGADKVRTMKHRPSIDRRVVGSIPTLVTIGSRWRVRGLPDHMLSDAEISAQFTPVPCALRRTVFDITSEGDQAVQSRKS
jgi:hypothetical protein